MQVGEHQTGAEHDRGVNVVAAGVADPDDGGAVRHVLLVDHGQRIDVGAQGDSAVAVSDVAHETGRNGQVAWFETGREQPLPDDACGTDLGPPQLGVGVQIAAEGNELVLVALGERRQFVEQVLHGVRGHLVMAESDFLSILPHRRCVTPPRAHEPSPADNRPLPDPRSGSVGRDVDAPDLPQRVADLADSGAGPQRVVHG